MNFEALSTTRTLKGNQAPFVVQELPEIAKHSDKSNIIDAIKLILFRKIQVTGLVYRCIMKIIVVLWSIICKQKDLETILALGLKQ